VHHFVIRIIYSPSVEKNRIAEDLDAQERQCGNSKSHGYR